MWRISKFLFCLVAGICLFLFLNFNPDDISPDTSHQISAGDIVPLKARNDDQENLSPFGRCLNTASCSEQHSEQGESESYNLRPRAAIESNFEALRTGDLSSLQKIIWILEQCANRYKINLILTKAGRNGISNDLSECNVDEMNNLMLSVDAVLSEAVKVADKSESATILLNWLRSKAELDDRILSQEDYRVELEGDAVTVHFLNNAEKISPRWRLLEMQLPNIDTAKDFGS